MNEHCFVVLYPRSLTNPSDKYRVVHSYDWQRFVNGATKSYGFTAFDTYAQAKVARDAGNKEL